MTTPENRLRDLLAFGMATEAGRPLTPTSLAALQQKADSELHGYAFRLLHNQIETIRREAMEEQRARGPRALGFVRTVLANLVALLLAGGGAVALFWYALPNLPPR